MKTTTIRAVEMVRRIRDAHYELLCDKSPEELTEFYRTKARSLQMEIAAPQQRAAGEAPTG